MAAGTRFPVVSCSECGQDFGPGDHGYSHCADHHDGLTTTDVRSGTITASAMAARRPRARAGEPRYRAYIQTASAEVEVYRNRPNGNLIGELPFGARPMPNGECGTLDRTDGGDPFECARFILPSGRIVVVARQAGASTRLPVPHRIVVIEAPNAGGA